MTYHELRDKIDDVLGACLSYYTTDAVSQNFKIYLYECIARKLANIKEKSVCI